MEYVREQAKTLIENLKKLETVENIESILVDLRAAAELAKS